MPRLKCNDCELTRINGLVCHETGCPSSWIDPTTGEGYAVECKGCECEFYPQNKGLTFCSESCIEDYWT